MRVLPLLGGQVWRIVSQRLRIDDKRGQLRNLPAMRAYFVGMIIGLLPVDAGIGCCITVVVFYTARFQYVC
jgi:sulfite exporter TauE/SafE